MPPREVRLTPREQEEIGRAIDAASAETAVVWKRASLFGSRVDPSARGGDIDLYLEVDGEAGGDIDGLARQLRLAIQDRLGERKVDIVIDDGRKDLGAFGEVVKRTKVDLWTSS